ncbi:MAG: polymerase sporulation-specific sigma factor [Actinomycetota bacterium]|jgi:RNA polymerase sporulation-specific sigma factor|nr:polymerase sporulation-specific sigma factor [Actinomycetota bacterium]
MSKEYLQLDLQDEELIERARLGDELAIESLLYRYRHYARAKARSYFLAGADKEDIVQEGMIGLFKAIRDFRPEKNIAFRAFAELCITRQIITAIKTATRQKHQPLNSYVSLNKPAPGDEEDRPLSDVLVISGGVDPADLVVSAEEIANIKESMSRLLSDLETEVLQLYMDGKSYQQIADMLGRHVKSIDNALQRIKRKLEQHLLVRDAETV